jgi:metal-dependent amidase/aminoacylase/carboxypeptidase family protein
VNDARINNVARQVAERELGKGSVEELQHASMGAEDFSFYLQHAPGAMFRLGLGDVTPLHTPTFDFADAAIPVGVKMLSGIAKDFFEE